MMTQNVYDRADFFVAYQGLERSRKGLDGAPEWPALRAMLPDLTGLRVLDLGCGFGWFARWARENGAASVLALDVSERMLAQARAETRDGAITYLRADLEVLDVAAGGFDLAYSSLAFHYIRDLPGLLLAVHTALVPGGRLVFSTEHPIFTAPARPGWSVAADGGKSWPVDGYLKEGPRVTDWLAPGVTKYHRTIGRWVETLIRGGFNIEHLEEWSPTDAQIADRPGLAEERERPMFLLAGAHR